MTLEQLEQRVTDLEEFAEELRRERSKRRNQVPASKLDAASPGEDDLIPGAEYPLVVDVPPKQVFHFTAKLTSVEPGPRGLALSEAEWASLQLEEDNE